MQGGGAAILIPALILCITCAVSWWVPKMED